MINYLNPAFCLVIISIFCYQQAFGEPRCTIRDYNACVLSGLKTDQSNSYFKLTAKEPAKIEVVAIDNSNLYS